MGERYLITGVQLGTLLARDNKLERRMIIEDIVDTQFICDTDNTDIENDVVKISKLLHDNDIKFEKYLKEFKR